MGLALAAGGAGAQTEREDLVRQTVDWVVGQPSVVVLQLFLPEYQVGRGTNGDELEAELTRIELALATGSADRGMAERAELLRFLASVELLAGAAGGNADVDLAARASRVAAQVHLELDDPAAAVAALEPGGPTQADWVRLTGHALEVGSQQEVVEIRTDRIVIEPLARDIQRAFGGPAHAALLDRAVLRLAQIESQTRADAWLDERLEPWAAEFVRARFGEPQEDVFEAVRSRGATREATYAPWEVPGRTIELLSLERRAGSELVEAIVAGLLRGDPDGVVELDRLLEPRDGLVWRRILVESLAYVLSRDTQHSTLIGLTPLVVELLGDRRVYRETRFRDILARMAAGPDFVPANLVETWRDAIATASREQAEILTAHWGSLPNEWWGDAWPQLRPGRAWHAEVLSGCLANSEPQVRLMGVGLFAAHPEGRAMLDWVGEEDVRLRRAALHRLVESETFQVESIDFDPASSAAVRALLEDPDDELHARARACVLAARVVAPEWILTLYDGTPADERLAVVEQLRDALRPSFELNPLVLSRGLRDRLAADADPRLRASLFPAPWHSDELVAEVVVRAASDPAPEVLAAVDRWLASTWAYRGPVDAVLAVRLRNGAAALDLDAFEDKQLRHMIERIEDRGAILELAVARDDRALIGALLDELARGGYPSPALLQTAEQLGVSRTLELLDRFLDLAEPSLRRRLADAVTFDSKLRREALARPSIRLEIAWRAVASARPEDELTVDAILVVATRSIEEVFHPRRIGEDAFERGIEGLEFAGANVRVVAWLDATDPTWGEPEVAREIRQIVYTLLDPGGPGAVEAAIAILEDALDCKRSNMTVPPLLPADLGPVVLGALDDERVVAAVEAIVPRLPHGDVLGLAASTGLERMVAPIAGLLEASDELIFGSTGYNADYVKIEAARALRRFPTSQRATDALRLGMLSDSASIRSTCASVLESFAAFAELGRAVGGETVTGAKARLFEMLEAGDPATRAEAARALATIGAVEALPDLIEALADPDSTVRLAAREALDRLNALPPRVSPPADSPADEG